MLALLCLIAPSVTPTTSDVFAPPSEPRASHVAAREKDDVWGRPLTEWAGLLGGEVRWGNEFLDRLTAVRALRAAGRKSERHIDALIAAFDPALAADDTEHHEYLLYALRIEVAEALVAIGPKALPKLAQALVSERSRLRLGAAFVATRLHHNAEDLRTELEAALGAEQDPLVKVWLLAALAGASADPTVQVDALLESLDAARARSADEPKTDQAQLGSVHFELQAHLMALGHLGAAAHSAIPKLEAYLGQLGSLDCLLRATLVACAPAGTPMRAGQMDELVEVLLAEALYMPSQHAVRVLGTRVLAPLLDAIEAPERAREERVAGAWMLNWLGSDGIDTLTHLAADPDLERAKVGLEVLQSVAGPEHAAALAPSLALRHDLDSRKSLSLAFGYRGGAAALEVLVEGLGSRDTLVQLNALRCLPVLAVYAPKLDGWKQAEQKVKGLGRSRDAQVKLESDVTARAIAARPR
ncbi:MAG: hypothetical protein R3F49_18580 [Planctomycetota bacterium]